MPGLLKMLPTALIFVADAEADDYLRAGVPKDHLRVHPDLKGLARIRNFIDAKVPNEICVQIDDDLKMVVVWSGGGYRQVTNHEEIDRILYVTAQAATDARVKLFAWGRRGNPAYFFQNNPFSFTNPIAAAFGQIGRTLRWDDNLIGNLEDTDLTLQSLMKDRIVLIDTRYYFHFGKTWGEKGGAQAIRTQEVRDRDVEYVQKKWGKYLDCTRKSRGATMSNRIKVQRKISY